MPRGVEPTVQDEHRPWWEAAFADLYLELYAHRDDASAAEEVAGVLPRLRTAPGPILDACCGNGRHLAAIRAAGLPAVGFDLSPQLLEVAGSRGECRGRILRGDLQALPVTAGLGAITLFFTAYGYFEHHENQSVLEALARCLASEGWLLLDLPDPDHLVETLVPHSERVTSNGTRVMEQRHILGNRVQKTVTAKPPGGSWQRYTESVRLYRPDELAIMSDAAGLVMHDRWSSLRGPDHRDHRHVHWLRKP